MKRFISRNVQKKLSLQSAADRVYLSPKYLSRIFKQETGIGFNEYVLTAKVDHAKKLLRSTGHNIDQIAEELGYRNTESFIRIFKKFTGTTPTQFRLAARKGSGRKASAARPRARR